MADMTPQRFIAKWKRSKLKEKSAAQEHFIDLCHMLGHPTPAEDDPDGTHFTFERGAKKLGGEDGWADVWKRGHFGWEYKGKRKDLEEAYKQLLQYREDLENPPLLVVSDMERFEVHTNFVNTVKAVHAFTLDELDSAENLKTLRAVFTRPESLRPGLTPEHVTEKAAEEVAALADGLRERGVDPHDAAHFLMKLIFCLFAEDENLLPPKIFTRIIDSSVRKPSLFPQMVERLFAAMATGGFFGTDVIEHFNGGLFSDDLVLPLNQIELKTLHRCAVLDWSEVEPAIFGTLFERSLDPAKRSQIGAHYTSREDIETIVEPVLMAPLRAEWDKVRSACEEDVVDLKKTERAKAVSAAQRSKRTAAMTRIRSRINKRLREFEERLTSIRVLDPACGSGNFLYVSLNLLKDLEKEVVDFAAGCGLTDFPKVSPAQLLGIEINPYAHELAQVVVWIGYLQWGIRNGFTSWSMPILKPLDTIREMDAVLDLSDPEAPIEPNWPEADVIVGNPPFLGGKLLRNGLGDEYVDTLFRVYDDRVPREADLCCYWFEKARAHIEKGKIDRAGLLATQGIRGGANRRVLERIKESGDIFFAESDREWMLDGAAVHVSMVGFAGQGGEERAPILDGQPVQSINPDLTSGLDLTQAHRLRSNADISFIGDSKGGPFELEWTTGVELLRVPNPHGQLNSQVVHSWMNGKDIADRPRHRWIIDFGLQMSPEEASRFEAPFQYVQEHVRPKRRSSKRARYRDLWWIHEEARPGMRKATRNLERFPVLIRHSKHRFLKWAERPTLPDSALVVFARSDDFFFGVLHSKVHELWALRKGTQLEDRPRYTPTTTFETFPFPWPLGEAIPADKADVHRRISEAAKELNALRENWLNPPEWVREEPPLVEGHPPRLVPHDADCAAKLKKRTLTNLYNERPTWLAMAHEKLDQAVLDAYDWPHDIGDEEILAKLLTLNLEQAEED